MQKGTPVAFEFQVVRRWVDTGDGEETMVVLEVIS